MDPKVEKLLEGKPDEWKFQAIAFSYACLLTGPKGNSSRDVPYHVDEHKTKANPQSSPKFSFEETSDEEDLSE